MKVSRFALRQVWQFTQILTWKHRGITIFILFQTAWSFLVKQKKSPGVNRENLTRKYRLQTVIKKKLCSLLQHTRLFFMTFFTCCFKTGLSFYSQINPLIKSTVVSLLLHIGHCWVVHIDLKLDFKFNNVAHLSTTDTGLSAAAQVKQSMIIQ